MAPNLKQLECPSTVEGNLPKQIIVYSYNRILLKKKECSNDIGNNRDESQNIILSKINQIQENHSIYIKIQEQPRLTYGDRNQNRGFLWCRMTGRGCKETV